LLNTPPSTGSGNGSSVGELAEIAETKILRKPLARLSLRAIWKSLHDFARESRASAGMAGANVLDAPSARLAGMAGSNMLDAPSARLARKTNIFR